MKNPTVTPLPWVLFDAYQKTGESTAVYQRKEGDPLGGFNYTIIGLCGEAGELANKYKKAIRDGWKPDTREVLADELGDVLWYVAACARELNIPLSEIARMNVEKLALRRQQNALHDSGQRGKRVGIEGAKGTAGVPGQLSLTTFADIRDNGANPNPRTSH